MDCPPACSTFTMTQRVWAAPKLICFHWSRFFSVTPLLSNSKVPMTTPLPPFSVSTESPTMTCASKMSPLVPPSWRGRKVTSVRS